VGEPSPRAGEWQQLKADGADETSPIPARDGHDFMRFHSIVVDAVCQLERSLNADIGETHQVMTVPSTSWPSPFGSTGSAGGIAQGEH
jgi:hypothetical protein